MDKFTENILMIQQIDFYIQRYLIIIINYYKNYYNTIGVDSRTKICRYDKCLLLYRYF